MLGSSNKGKGMVYIFREIYMYFACIIGVAFLLNVIESTANSFCHLKGRREIVFKL